MECRKFREYKSGKLLGFADIAMTLNGKLTVFPGFKLFEDNGKKWASFPSQEYKDPEGNTKYSPICFFVNKQDFEETCRQARDAIIAFIEKGNTFKPEFSPPVQEELPF